MPLLLAQRESECKELEEKNSKLNALQSDYNYLDIKRAKQEAENIVNDYDKVFNEMGLRNIDLITKSEFDKIVSSEIGCDKLESIIKITSQEQEFSIEK